MNTKTDSYLSRRKFIQGSAILGASGLVGAKSASGASKAQVAKAKNLIFLVPDGMCQGTLGLAHHWSLRNRKEELNWIKLYDRPDLNKAMQETASASSPVTDSAAAASAWGSGTRVMNRALNTTANGKKLKPIMHFAKEAGKATGLVSTCRITHATPAGFTASVPHRNEEEAIAQQYFDLGVDVLLGGGVRYFKSEARDLVSEFENSGYAFCSDEEALLKAKNKEKILGLFSRSHIPYAIDRENDASLSGVPSLKTMFEAALSSLSQSKDGFVLQVEAGRVDHAGHGNDPAAILHELLEFDSCIPVALEFMEKNPDTLVIVSTDHGTGGCQLDGLGGNYNESGPALDRINSISYSFEWLETKLRMLGGVEPDLVEAAFGFKPSAKQCDELLAALNDPSVRYLSNSISSIFGDELLELTATGWSSHNHTSENVELLAFGPGAEKVQGFVRNNEVFGIMTEALGIA